MSSKPQLVSPHCHVQSLDSGSTPEAFISRELELGTGAITVTDHGTLIACRKVYDLAKKAKIIPILGLEGYFRDDSCQILQAGGVSKVDDKLDKYWRYGHFTTHFKDQKAFEVGVRLLSKAPTEQHGTEAKPIFGWDQLEELCAANVTITTGCLIGIIGRHLLQNDRPDMAVAYLDKLRSITKPGQLMVEVFPHVCTHNYVNAVFIVSKGSDKPRKYHEGKWLRTNVGEIRAADLAQTFGRQHNKHTHLLGVKNYHTWEEISPEEIVSVDHKDGEIPNECRPWAPTGDVQLGINNFLLDLARKHKIPVVVSDDAHFAYPSEKIVQDVRLAQSGNLRFTGSYHRQSTAEAWEYFKAAGITEAEFDSWVDTSIGWAQSFKDFKFNSKPELPAKFWEPKYSEVGAKNSVEYIMHLVEKHGRMDWSNAAWIARLKEELELFHFNGEVDLLPYFFIDEEACSVYTAAGEITGVGRGSAAGVLLMYLLGITHADPIKWGLSLDRFLTMDRIKSGKWPDVDQDLPHRELLTQWLEERFGDHSAQISTVSTLKLSSAVLDVARFKLGRVPPHIAGLSKAFERPPQGIDDAKFVHGYDDSGIWIQGSIERDPALKEYIATYPDHWGIVKKCLGLVRASGRHASAYIIANKPIHEFIPTTQISGVRCTQFTASAVEASGGLKMDFLIIDVLRDIAAAIKLIQERVGAVIPDEGMHIDGKYVPKVRILPLKTGGFADIWDLPEEQPVFDDLLAGKTETVFQYDTDGVRQWIKQFNHSKPDGKKILDSVRQMAIFTALDRPGPLDAELKSPEWEGHHNVLVEYARRARGLPKTEDLLPVFDELFPETYGLMIFQEQMQAAYQKLTGCTGAEAETFRSHVAKKNKDKIIAAYPSFIEKATATLNGDKDSAEAVWKLLNAWSAYGFNASHAVSYAITAYACAYLKHHHELEWWCCTLRHASSKKIKERLWKHCHHLVKLPSIANVVDNYSIVGYTIQAPLSLLEGLGDAANAEISNGAPYESIRDFLVKKAKTKAERGRSSIHSGIINKMMLAGAFDDWFEEGTPLIEKMQAYEQCVFELENENRLAAGKRPKKAPASVDTSYLNLSQWNGFQLKKSVLPGAWADLLDFVPYGGIGNIELTQNNYLKFKYLGDLYPMSDLAGFRALRDNDVGPHGKSRAIIVYVKEVREFKYPRNVLDKEALAISFDLEGEEFELVKWPEKGTGKLSKSVREAIKTGLNGAIAVLLVSKWKNGKPTSIETIEIIEPPFKQQENKDGE